MQLLKIYLKNMVGASRFERPVRPAHQLAGVPKVAPYSSRRHPPALPQELSRSNFVSKIWSGRADLNGRPPAPKAGALTRLRYAPTSIKS